MYKHRMKAWKHDKCAEIQSTINLNVVNKISNLLDDQTVTNKHAILKFQN